MKIIEFGPVPRAEFDEAFDWYAQRSPTAARNFATAIDKVFGKILAAPKQFSETAHGCRYCTVKRYPYRVIFREEGDRIRIVAIAHSKRRPNYWHKRLR